MEVISSEVYAHVEGTKHLHTIKIRQEKMIVTIRDDRSSLVPSVNRMCAHHI